MKDNPISFAWTYPRKRDGNVTAYCFAYSRDRDTNGVLYAGVKFEGLESELGRCRARLRMTAVKRLFRKPIYGVYVNSDEVVKDNKHKFNGFDGYKSKWTSSMAKFFVNCGMDKFANVGICCKKGEADFMMKYEEGKCTEVKNNGKIYVKYGYIWDGKEMRRVISQGTYGFGKGNEQIVNLYQSARFFGKGKERVNLGDFNTLTKEYMNQFGLIGDDKCFKGIKMESYHLSGKYKYFRSFLSNTKRVHIVFMYFNDWIKLVSKVNDNYYWTDEDMTDVICMAYSVEDMNSVDNFEKNGRRNLHRKIAIDRLIYRPNIMYRPEFEYMDIKEKRMWFFKRIGLIEPEGERKFSHFDGELVFSKEMTIFSFSRYNEDIDFYNFVEEKPYSFWGALFGIGSK